MKTLLCLVLVAGVAAAWYFMHPAKQTRRQAAAGVYFLREYYSFPTKSGSTGWAPGQEVHENSKVARIAGKITVGVGTYESAVPENLLTRDIEDAEALRLVDGESQARESAVQALATQRARQSEQQINVAAAKDMDKLNADQVAQSTVGNYQSRLGESSRVVSSGGAVTYSVPYYATGSAGSASAPAGNLPQRSSASQSVAIRPASVATRSTPPPVVSKPVPTPVAK